MNLVCSMAQLPASRDDREYGTKSAVVVMAITICAIPDEPWLRSRAMKRRGTFFFSRG
jgi:hypothetical protein